MKHLETLSFLPDGCVAPGADRERRILEAYGACGVCHMVLSHPLCRRYLEDASFLRPLLETLDAFGMDFRDCHAPYGDTFDFNGDGSSLEDHRRLLALCVELGIKTYTVHLGNLYGGQTIAQALSQARRIAERLVPWAERAGVVLCVENIYYPTTTVGNLLDLLRDFPSPYFGLCYDSGHANLMTTGVRRGILCDWVRATWDGPGIEPAYEDFTPLWPYLATCHLHDNPGDSDAHMPPGWKGGVIDWPVLFERLAAAPRLVTMQTEVHTGPYGCSAADVVGAFERVFPAR